MTCRTEPFAPGLTLRVCVDDEDMAEERIRTPLGANEETTEATVRNAMGAYLGRISLYRARRRLILQNIEIARAARNRGLGTKLYEWALGIACQEKRQLASSTMRSHFAEAFWRKQVKRGRARCDTAYSGEANAWGGPRAELVNDVDDGKITQAEFDRLVARLPKPKDHVWRCPRFIMRRDVCKGSRTLGRAR